MELSIVTFKFTDKSRSLRERGNSLQINRSGAVSGLGHEPHVEGGEGGEQRLETSGDLPETERGDCSKE